ncbi:hypothetical protein ACFOZY_09885 [Chungangia koreensis]|uniref:Uncharacterized protein n=1 Tax=Chungangia koreensis TaxID=752657 RepID=A0ABV8X461_9LACT
MGSSWRSIVFNAETLSLLGILKVLVAARHMDSKLVSFHLQ